MSIRALENTSNDWLNLKCGSVTTTGTQTAATKISVAPTIATPAGGNLAYGITQGVAAVGWYIGSGAPTLLADKGSLYSRTDGSTTNNRVYVASDSVGGWTNITTQA